MTPFRATLVRGSADIDGLWEALEASAERLGPHHSETLAAAHTLAISLWRVGDAYNAAVILKQALECLVSSFGRGCPATLAAQSDYSALLFELGRDEEAGSFELEAFENARTYLGKAHTVTCVLAWNRAMNCEQHGDLEAARAIITNELTWLLTKPASQLAEDQKCIRSMLAERLKWDDPQMC